MTMNFNDCPDSVLVAFARAGGELLNLLAPSDFADELADYIEACVQVLEARAVSREADTEPLVPVNPAYLQ